jgi:hypothetical protein
MNDFNTLAPGVLIFSGSDDYSGKKLTNPTVGKKNIGGKAAIPGINSTDLKNLDWFGVLEWKILPKLLMQGPIKKLLIQKLIK